MPTLPVATALHCNRNACAVTATLTQILNATVSPRGSFANGFIVISERICKRSTQSRATRVRDAFQGCNGVMHFCLNKLEVFYLNTSAIKVS